MRLCSLACRGVITQRSTGLISINALCCVVRSGQCFLPRHWMNRACFFPLSLAGKEAAFHIALSGVEVNMAIFIGLFWPPLFSKQGILGRSGHKRRAPRRPRQALTSPEAPIMILGQWTSASSAREDLSSWHANTLFSGHGSSTFGAAPNRQLFIMQIMPAMLVSWLSAVFSASPGISCTLPIATPSNEKLHAASTAWTCCLIIHERQAPTESAFLRTGQWTTASSARENLSG